LRWRQFSNPRITHNLCGIDLTNSLAEDNIMLSHSPHWQKVKMRHLPLQTATGAQVGRSTLERAKEILKVSAHRRGKAGPGSS
jgi:hypothetical protein